MQGGVGVRFLYQELEQRAAQKVAGFSSARVFASSFRSTKTKQPGSCEPG
jgi:hypothetical protein